MPVSEICGPFFTEDACDESAVSIHERIVSFDNELIGVRSAGFSCDPGNAQIASFLVRSVLCDPDRNANIEFIHTGEDLAASAIAFALEMDTALAGLQ